MGPTPFSIASDHSIPHFFPPRHIPIRSSAAIFVRDRGGTEIQLRAPLDRRARSRDQKDAISSQMSWAVRSTRPKSTWGL